VSGAVALVAAAKLTLSLRITGVRADGYHLIDAEMISLSLFDVVTVDPTRTGIAATGPFADGVPTDASNLVARALRLAGRQAHVTIDKRIPHGGGLGGGSTDAAAVLRWAGYDDVRGAATIGADVSFCLAGGHARVRGIGEIVEPLPHTDRVVTLVIPPLGVSTPAAYRAWDALGGPAADGPNDLEPAALSVEPALARWRDRVGNASGQTPVLAGSGATWFVYGEHSNALATLSDEGAVIVAARAVPTGWNGSSAAGT
jgi:4-diphosphocytidyl-2-C-methyl-D-erythritol kinase